MRLIGSFVYILEPLRAPRAALGQPKSSQELQEQALGYPSAAQRQFSKFDRKTIRIARDIPKKVKKTSCESVLRPQTCEKVAHEARKKENGARVANSADTLLPIFTIENGPPDSVSENAKIMRKKCENNAKKMRRLEKDAKT